MESTFSPIKFLDFEGVGRCLIYEAINPATDKPYPKRGVISCDLKWIKPCTVSGVEEGVFYPLTFDKGKYYMQSGLLLELDHNLLELLLCSILEDALMDEHL